MNAKIDNLAQIRTSVERLHFSPTLEINEYVNKYRNKGAQILHMGFGQSPFPVHPKIQEALAVHADKNMYLPSAGLPELRQLAKNFCSSELGFDSEGMEVIIGPGSKELIYDIQLALAGDLVLPVPSWVSYAPQAILTRDQVIKIPTHIEENHHVTPESLDEAITTARSQGQNPIKLILNYPNNPTGLSISPSRLDEIAQVCRDHQLVVISDEIYGLVSFKQNHVSIAKFYPEGTIVTSGLSKHLSLGGYRLGVALIPKTLENVYDSVVRIASETWSTVSAPIQFAALEAFSDSADTRRYIDVCTRIHARVSGYAQKAILSLGIPYPELEGAFYLYPNFDRFGKELKQIGVETSEQLAKKLIDTVHIASLPGTAFGDVPGNLTLRLACCDFDGQKALDFFLENPECTDGELVDACCPNITLACERLAEFFLARQSRRSAPRS